MGKLQYAATEVWEGQMVIIRAQVVAADGGMLHSDTPVDAYQVTSDVLVRVYDLSGTAPHTAVYSTTATAASTLNTAAQGFTLDGTWSVDSVGHNFHLNLAGEDTLFAMQGGHSYRVECVVTSATWGSVPVVAIVAVKSRHSL